MKNFKYFALMTLMSIGGSMTGSEKLQQDEKAHINEFAPDLATLSEEITTRCPNTLWTRLFGESTECRKARNNKRDFIEEFGSALRRYHYTKRDEALAEEYRQCNHKIFIALLLGGKKRCDQAEEIRRYHIDAYNRVKRYDANELEALIKQAAETSCLNIKE